MNKKEIKKGRHAELVSASSTQAVWQRQQQALKTLKQVQGDFIIKNRAFTLIELLVVVLIIGILAAVALPQYQKAVWKTRMSTILPIMRAVKEANERYYMENNTYSDSLENLDMEIPAGDVANVQASGLVCYSNGTCFDNIFSWSEDALGIHGGLGSGYNSADSCYITMYYDHSTKQGEFDCGGNHPKCAEICKMMGYNN